MVSSQKADIGYKSNSSSTSSTSNTSKNSKPSAHKKVNNAIHKTEAKKTSMRYNKNLTMHPMPESFLKSKIFFKTYYPFLFVDELNKTEALVASYIYTFYEHTKAVFAKPSTLSKYLNIDKSQMSKILNHLIELGVVKKEQQGENILYTPLLDTDEMTQFACNLNPNDFNKEVYIEEDEEKEKEEKTKEIKPSSQSASTPTVKPTPAQSTPQPTSTSAPKPKPKLPPLPPEIQAQIAKDNFDMIYYDTPPYYMPNKVDELNLRPYNLRFGVHSYPKPGDPDFDVSDRLSPYYDPEDDPDNEAYWDWSDDIPVPKKKARQIQQAQQTKAITQTTQAKTDTIKPAASASNNTTYWR